MKKLALIAAVLLCGWQLAKADMRLTPRGEPQALASADYGGYDVSTHAFLVSGATVVSSGRGVVWGVNFSSGQAGDCMDVYDATATIVGVRSNNYVRFTNVVGSTGGINANPTGGFAGLGGKSWHFNKGLILNPCATSANNLYNMINLLYYKEPDQ